MASNGWRAAGAALGLAASGAAAAYAALAGLPAATLTAGLCGVAIGIALIDAAARPPLRPEKVSDADLRERARLAVQAMLDESPTPLILADGETLTALNRSSRKLFGVDGRIPEPSSALILAIAEASSVTLSAAGESRTFAVGVSDIDGFGRVASLVDIGAELRIAEAAAARDLMLVLSHEIMNGMTPIASLAQTAAELAAEGSPVTAALREAVTTIARRAEGLARFSLAYRDLARLPPPRRVEIAAGQLIDDLAQLFRTRWLADAVMLSTIVTPSDFRLTVDGDQIASALWALCQNAAEACIEANTTHARIMVEVRSRNKQVVYTISDTGPGISLENRDRIFEPFFTTRPCGSGVGLALARQVFRSHGGDLVLAEAMSGKTQFVGTTIVVAPRFSGHLC